MNGDKNKKNNDKQGRYKVINRPNVKKKKVFFFVNFFPKSQICHYYSNQHGEEIRKNYRFFNF